MSVLCVLLERKQGVYVPSPCESSRSYSRKVLSLLTLNSHLSCTSSLPELKASFVMVRA